MPPKKQGQSRGNQRQTNQPKSKPISEYLDHNLYGNLARIKQIKQLSRENPEIEDILDQIKDVEDFETRENILQNFVQLVFKLVGLNSFTIKLEDKSFQSIDADFMKTEVEQNLKGVKDFNWVFTSKREEHKFLKDNLYVFLDSIIQQNQYYEGEEESFMHQLTQFLIMLSRSNIQNVRQNIVRLARIIVEQGLIRIEKLRAAEKRKLDKEELFLKKNLENIINQLIKGIFQSRVIDKNEGVQQDCIESFDIFFNLSPQIALTSSNLIQLSKLFDTNVDLVNSLLKVLVNIKWSESDSSKNALQALVQNDKFRKRLIYFSNFATFVTSFRAIQLINIIDETLPGSIKDKDLKRVNLLKEIFIFTNVQLQNQAMATIFHKYEEVRAEGLKILFKFLNIQENEKKITTLALDGDEDDGVNQIFSFKQQQNPIVSMGLIKRFYTLLDEVDPRIYEKEELIQNLINSLGFEFGALYDFQNIFKLLNQLPSSNLKDKKYDLFKLIVIILKKTMKLLSLFQSGEKISQNYSKQQQEKLILIQNEFFKALVNNFDTLYENMTKNVIFKEYYYILFLSIPAIDLQQNLKETQFKNISKNISEDILNTILNQNDFIETKSQSMGLIFSCFSALQFFLIHTPKSYSDPFKVCKEKVIQQAIVESTESIHEIIVQGKDTTLDLQEIQEEYTFLFIKLFSCTNLLSQLDSIYCEDFIQKCLEITDAATSSTSSDNSCIYTFTSLGLQLDFYLNVLRVGLSESCNKASKLEEYLKYKFKIIKQLWLFLREEKKKLIQFNLEADEYKKILFKSYYSIIEGLTFISNQKLKHLPIYVQIQSDDPLFYALIDYISYYNPSEYPNGKQQADNNELQEQSNQQQNNKNKKMIAEQDNDKELNQNKIKPINERVLMQMQSSSQKQITDIQLILIQFCKLTLCNPRYLYSNFGIHIFKNFFDCESKEIVDLLRKNLGASRISGERSSGFPPFWKVVDQVITQLLDEGKDINLVKKFATFAHKAYFNETISEGNVQIKPKECIRELCERQIYYLTAKTAQLLSTPNKLNTLDAIGHMLSLKINYPKSLDPNHLLAIQSLQKKYQTFFLKKVQDYVKEFKENNQHLQSFDDTILSEKSKQIIYKYVKNMESWSSVKFNVDPYGEGEEVLEKQREEIEKSEKKQQKETDQEEEEQNESGSESSNEEEQDEEKNTKLSRNQKSMSKSTDKKTRSSSRGNSRNQKSSKKMEDENEEKGDAKASVRKTKKDKNQSSSMDRANKGNDKKDEQKKVDTTKKNYRRQKK